MVHMFHPRSGEVEVRGSEVQGQPPLHGIMWRFQKIWSPGYVTVTECKDSKKDRALLTLCAHCSGAQWADAKRKREWRHHLQACSHFTDLQSLHFGHRGSGIDSMLPAVWPSEMLQLRKVGSAHSGSYYRLHWEHEWQILSDRSTVWLKTRRGGFECISVFALASGHIVIF